MKLILLILFPFFLSAQYKFTDEDYHWHAGMACAGLGTSTAYWFTSNKMVSALIGSVFGYLCGEVKEEFYDRYLGLGTPSKKDKFKTGQGSFTQFVCATINIDINEKRIARIDTMKFQNLNTKQNLAYGID